MGRYKSMQVVVHVALMLGAPALYQREKPLAEGWGGVNIDAT